MNDERGPNERVLDRLTQDRAGAWKTYPLAHFAWPRDGDRSADAAVQYSRTVIDLLRLFHRWPAEQRERALREGAPPRTERRAWDAALAAALACAAVWHGYEPPAWTEDGYYRLDDPWFPWGEVCLLDWAEHEEQIQHSPHEFARRGVIIDPRDVDPRTGAPGPAIPGAWDWMRAWLPGNHVPDDLQWPVAFERAIGAAMPNAPDRGLTRIGEHEGREIWASGVHWILASKMRAARCKDLYDIAHGMAHERIRTWAKLKRLHDYAYRRGPGLQPGQREGLKRTRDFVRRIEPVRHPNPPHYAQPRKETKE